MDLIPLSSRRLQRENTEEAQGQVTSPCCCLLVSPAQTGPFAPPDPAPSLCMGVAGWAQAEKRGCCDLSSIFPGLQG